VFAVRVSPGGPTAASDAPPSDNAPATPNTVTAFVRRFRFEFRLACDTVKDLPISPRAQQHINRPTRRLPLQQLRQLGDIRRNPPRTDFCSLSLIGKKIVDYPTVAPQFIMLTFK
jgi:hypothetical protein